jgi:hypothetical protein
MRMLRVLSVVSAILIGSSLPAFGGTISIQPLFVTEVVGETFSVDIQITSVSDLYAFEFDLGFNPLVVKAIGITEGPFLPPGGATFFLPGAIDNTFGTITSNADTILGPVAGVSGTGVLASATFQAVGLGSSEITINNPLFLDSTGSSISEAVEPGSASVVFPMKVGPEPAPALLLCLALLGCVVLRRRAEGART